MSSRSDAWQLAGGELEVLLLGQDVKDTPVWSFKRASPQGLLNLFLWALDCSAAGIRRAFLIWPGGSTAGLIPGTQASELLCFESSQCF